MPCPAKLYLEELIFLEFSDPILPSSSHHFILYLQFLPIKEPNRTKQKKNPKRNITLNTYQIGLNMHFSELETKSTLRKVILLE